MQYKFSYRDVKHFFPSNVGRQHRTGKVNRVVSDLGPNPDSRIYKLSSCPAVPPAVSSSSLFVPLGMDDSEGHQRVLPTQPHPHPGPHEFSHPIFPLFGVFLSIRHLIAYHMPNNAEHRGYTTKGSLRTDKLGSTCGEWVPVHSPTLRILRVKFLLAQILGQSQPLVIVSFQLVGLDAVEQCCVVFTFSLLC